MVDMESRTKRALSRPDFLWDYDLNEEDLQAMLHGENEFEKLQMMTRVLESARWSDIWHYLTLRQVREYWPLLYARMRPETRDLWAWALETWERGTS